MTTSEKTWVSARDNYLRQVSEALKAARYPGAKSIIEEVQQHLESRYSELPPESRNWEGYQQLITAMGPPSDYVDLLGVGRLKRRVVRWKKIAIAAPLILIALVWAWDRGVIPLGSYNGPRTYVIPETVGAPWTHPFTADPELVGSWESVDFVHRLSEFVPGRPSVPRDRYLEELTFKADGTLNAMLRKRRPGLNMGNWTKGWIMDRRAEIQAQYAVREIGGQTYLFFPWLSGDVSRRYMPPCYYVMKRVPDPQRRVEPAAGTAKPATM
jgi:hypothetical protein